jgi:hypothetical protein
LLLFTIQKTHKHLPLSQPLLFNMHTQQSSAPRSLCFYTPVRKAPFQEPDAPDSSDSSGSNVTMRDVEPTLDDFFHPDFVSRFIKLSGGKPEEVKTSSSSD